MKKLYSIKKFYSITIILITFTIISCSNSSSKDLPDEYVNPFEKKVQTPQPTGYTINGTTGPSTSHAVIYQGTINDESYVGIAADNGLSNTAKFNLKIYWKSNATIEGPHTLTYGNYFIKIVDGLTTYDTIDTTTNSGNMKLDITAGTNNVYKIDFTQSTKIKAADLSDITINDTTDFIDAFLYK